MNARMNFAEVLASAGVDVDAEYTSLYTAFYDSHLKDLHGYRMCPRESVSDAFQWMSIRGTAVSLDDFDSRHGFDFYDLSRPITLDRLVSFCEYVVNLTSSYANCGHKDDEEWIMPIAEQVGRVIELIGYEGIWQGDYIIYVEKSPAATLVAESLPSAESYKVIAYKHHSLKGDLQEKRVILVALANLLEPRRSALKQIDNKLEAKLFSAFNNCNIRHDNITQGTANYKESVAGLSNAELEQVYDATYTLCLLAFLQLDDSANLDLLTRVLDEV